MVFEGWGVGGGGGYFFKYGYFGGGVVFCFPKGKGGGIKF